MSKCIIFSYKGRCKCRDELHLKWGHFISYQEVMLRRRFVLLKEFHPYYIIYCIFGLFYFREDGRDPILSTQATSATIIIYKFHIECLPLWEDFTCPVCWYVQTPEVVMDWESAADLRICMVCGRYTGRYTYQHFMQDQRRYFGGGGCNEGDRKRWDRTSWQGYTIK